jgi:two-component system, LytTR family, response regulator
MMRTLIVDDEEPARDRLRQLLSSIDDVEIVGEAGDGEQAIQQILELRPDLVFLDIQMPACSGLEVAASLPSPRPRIIFCTAFDQYAVDAFELHAIDYLLKPVSRARLADALSRARQAQPDKQESDLETLTQSGRTRPTRFLAKRGARFRVIAGTEVLYFASEEGLTKLCVADQHYWMEPTLNDLEARLDPVVFFRISRAAIVNLDSIQEVFPMPGGHGEVLLRNGTRLEISRRRFKELLEKLEGP